MVAPRTRGALVAVIAFGVASGALRPVCAQATRNGARTDSAGIVTGVVVTKEGDFPLAYSVVSVQALGLERFTDDRGAFRLADIPIGIVRLHVRHLGYTPVDIDVTARAGVTDTVRVALTHIAVRLTAMQVHAYPECKDPGRPSATSDSSFAIVFDQLRQNADQYRLLTNAYPFNYAFERIMSTVHADDALLTEYIDTLVLRSVDQWKYRPGAVLTNERSRYGTSVLMLNIPTLVSFADEVFIANHCFYNGGVESVDGVDLLRVDFVAASRIRDPDVDGSMYLDPSSFQIRRSLIHLSKLPRGLRGVRQVDVTTVFGEVLPSVPLIAAVSSVNELTDYGRQPDAAVRTLEEQRLIAVRFLKGKPGDEPRKP